MSLSATLHRPARGRAHAGLLRRVLRREATRLRQPRHLTAIILLAIVGGMGWRASGPGGVAGADARAYWAAVRIWLNGGDPYHPTGSFMPYVYARGCCPPSSPGPCCRGRRVVRLAGLHDALLLWSIGWAYRLRPLATAVVVALLGFSFLANIDTGNINLLLVLMIWAAQFTAPRTAGLLWALATALKWVPIVLLPLLAPRGRAWGAIFLAIAGVLTLVTLPGTLVQLQVLFAFPRPARVDDLVFLWGLVPWLWRDPAPARLLRPSTWLGGARDLIADLGRPQAAAPASGGPSGFPTSGPARTGAADRLPRRSDGRRSSAADEATLAGARGERPEERSIERVDAGERAAQAAEAVGEDRVLGVGGEHHRPAARLQRGEVRRAGHRRVERGQVVLGRSRRRQMCLQPAHAHLGIGRPRSRPAARYEARKRACRASSPLWAKAKRPAPSRNGWVSAMPSQEKRDGRRR